MEFLIEEVIELMDNVFVDVETTSFHKTFRRPWEIALIADHNASVTYHVDDLDLTGSDEESLAKSAFWKRYNKDSEIILLSENIIAKTVHTITRNRNLIGCATWFDAAVLEEMLERNNLPAEWNDVICIQKLVSDRVGKRVQGLAKCADLLGIYYKKEELHSAFADAKLAKEIYKKVIND